MSTLLQAFSVWRAASPLAASKNWRDSMSNQVPPTHHCETALHRPNKEKTMSRNIEGKIVVITGASSGLGESIARHLAKLGATVVLGARRKNRLDAIVNDIQAAGGKALPVTVDVAKRVEVGGLVQKALDTYGKNDRLVNNAGLMPIEPLELLKVEQRECMSEL